MPEPLPEFRCEDCRITFQWQPSPTDGPFSLDAQPGVIWWSGASGRLSAQRKFVPESACCPRCRLMAPRVTCASCGHELSKPEASRPEWTTETDVQFQRPSERSPTDAAPQ